MYPVSEAFLQAVQENTRRYYWSGRIRTTKGATYEFGADDIVKGSGYISSQCCGSKEANPELNYHKDSEEYLANIMAEIPMITRRSEFLSLYCES